MKVLVSLVLATSLIATQAVLAGPSKGRVVTLCKAQIEKTFGEGAHVRIKRIRDRKTTFRVKPVGKETLNLVCTVEKDHIELAHRDGQVINALALGAN